MVRGDFYLAVLTCVSEWLVVPWVPSPSWDEESGFLGRYEEGLR